MITCEVRFSYLNVFEPKETPSGDLKYSASILIPKDNEEGVKEIKAAINAAVKQGIEKNKFSAAEAKSSRFKIPLRDGDKEFEEGNRGPEYKGHYFLNASSVEKPGIVGPDIKPLMNKDEFYSGCYGRADINFFPYKAAGNIGIGVGLNNLMKTRDGDRLDGRMPAEQAFAAFAQLEETDENPFAGDLE